MLHKLWTTLGIVGGCLLALVVFVPTLHAQTTITVDTFADAIDTNLDCSLREAIIAANTNITTDGCLAGSGDDTILLAAGFYTLTIAGVGEQAALTGDLDIVGEEGLTIQGAGMISTTIDAGAIDRAFEIITPLTRVIVRDLTIQNGLSPTGQGSGAIRTVGHLTLINTLLQNNTVEGTTSDDVGGAICNGCGLGVGHLTIVDSTIRNNEADRAGGIFSNAMLTMTNSSIVSNRARAGGGLINYAAEDKRVTISNSTISGNVAENNSGGIGQFGESIVISSSTIAYNVAQSGAGINTVGGNAILHNTLFASNGPGSSESGSNCATFGETMIVSNGYNWSDDPSCAFDHSDDVNEVDPLLLPLDQYGGPTPTHRLSILSPAIDAGTVVQCPATDQRGISRPQMVACDIGAFEYDGAFRTLYLPSAQNNTP